MQILPLLSLLSTPATPFLLKHKGECTKLSATFGQCYQYCKEYVGYFSRDSCVRNATTGKNYCRCSGWPPNGFDYVCPPGFERCGNGFFRRCLPPRICKRVNARQQRKIDESYAKQEQEQPIKPE